MVALNDFGVNVKIRLIEIGETQTWLVDQVREQVPGSRFTLSYLYKLMTGRVTSKPMTDAITKILDL